MKIIFYIFFFIFLTFSEQTKSQTLLADFEDITTGGLILNTDDTNPNLFSQFPGVYNNPDKNGINKSEKCFGAVNVANVGWWRNYVELKLKTPVTITESNRMLCFLAYRSIQPKEMRIGFNDYEKEAEIYFDKTLHDGAWDRIIIDLGATHLNQTLESIWIIFSCNRSEPNSGWREASYYFDDFLLSSTTLSESSVVIHPNIKFQTMEDFGASDCWTTNFIGKYWDEKEKEFAAEKLFSREIDDFGNPKGIGLSTWRVNVGAGTENQGEESGITDITRRSECFLNADGTYDWTKQSGQQYFMEMAKEYGCENMVLFSNSPPIYFTKNGKGFAESDTYPSNLLNDKFDEFADFLTTTANHFVTEGYNITHISPVNEPQWDWTSGQEGSPWENTAIKKLAVELNTSLAARNIDTKISLAEAGSWDKLYKDQGRASNQIDELFNPESKNFVGNLEKVDHHISGHSYWTFKTNRELKEVRSAVGKKACEYNLKVYQTEWSFLDAPPAPSTRFAANYETASFMDFGLFLGKMIYSDIVFANASSWSFWTAISNEVYGHKSRFLLLRYTPLDDAGGYNSYASILNGGKIEDTPNLWALGNYSLFVRPGYTRIRLDGASEMNNLLGTAYISPDGNKIVVVFVNMHSKSRKVNVTFNKMMGQATSVSKFVTNATYNLQKDLSFDEKNVDSTCVLSPRSITSLVYNIDKNSTSNAKTDREIQSLNIYPNPIKKRGRIKH